MALMQNQAITTPPNVLRAQTVPNTLRGVSNPGAAVRRGTLVGGFLAGLAALLVGVLIGLAAIVWFAG
jgi:hypothetical protein